MRQLIITVVLASAALSAAAQTPAPAPAAADRIVATVNGENITAARLDHLWNRMPARMRAQYEKTGGGKLGFLQNYLGKHLVVQNAIKNGYDKKPEVQAELDAARESALFDVYVREVVGAPFVTDATMRDFYNEHLDEYATPDRANIRMIKVSTKTRPAADARQILTPLMSQLFPARDAAPEPRLVISSFSSVAHAHSEDPSAQNGGSLGWVTRAQLDPAVAAAVFAMKPMTVSGIVEGADGLYVVLVEDVQPAGVKPYEAVRSSIREQLLQGNVQQMLEIVNKTTAELRASSKVTVYPENVQ